MASLKRKREKFEDSDDEDEMSFGRQILPVADLPIDFSAEPMDGMQYLFTVRRDARHLPHVTRAPNPYEYVADAPLPSQTASCKLPEYIILPSQQWRLLFETRIRNFRKNVNQPTIHIPCGPQDNRRLMPDKKERDMWWAYLAGKPESDWNSPKQPKKAAAQQKHPRVSVDASPSCKVQELRKPTDEGEVELVLRMYPSDSLPTPTGSPAPLEHGDSGPTMVASSTQVPIMGRPREPLPSLLRHIDQRLALHLLMYFTHWITNHLEYHNASLRPTETHAHWIFALLSKVEDHISADDMNLLRNLARACIAFLKELLRNQPLPPELQESPNLASRCDYMSIHSCWIIIAAVTTVWAQHDMWTDAEDMLKTLAPGPEILEV